MVEEHFGKNLKELRKRQNLTQAELANRANIGRSKIMRMEQLDTADEVINRDLEAVARVLAVRVDALVSSRVRGTTFNAKQVAAVMKNPLFSDIWMDLSEENLAKFLEFLITLEGKQGLSEVDRNDMISVFLAAIRGDL